MNSGKVSGRFYGSVGLYFCWITLAFAQNDETARVLDGCGGWSSNAIYTTVIAACQSCPVGVISGSTYISRGGFMESFLLDPGMDNDGDGIADENDPDDDNDGLCDTQEIDGTAFDPVTPTSPFLIDTDGDGVSDSIEVLSGTDPLDSRSVFEIASIGRDLSGVHITWNSREWLTYDLLRGSSLDELSISPVLVIAVTAGSGSGVWHETQSTATDPSGTVKSFYRLRLTRP